MTKHQGPIPGTNPKHGWLIALAWCALAPAVCSAQAWLPPKGEGSVSTTYQNVNFSGHFNSDGSRQPVFQSRASNVVFEMTYGITDRLALTGSLPYINSKYTGKETPLNPSRFDDGSYHGTLQDFRFELRCNAVRRPLSVTPFFAAVIPSHGYEVIGEASPGAHRREFVTGVYAGRLLNPVLPRAYVHGLYSYAFVERELNIPLNRSNADVQLGYFVAPAVSVSFLWSWQRTHGGLSFDDIIREGGIGDIFVNHDRLVRSNFQHVGVGASLALSKSVDLYANVVKFTSGSNTHYGRAVSVGVTWKFQTRREAPAPSSGQPAVGSAAFANQLAFASFAGVRHPPRPTH